MLFLFQFCDRQNIPYTDSRRFHDTLSCEALSSLIPLTVALTSNLYSNAWQNIHKIRSHYRTKKAALCCSPHDLLIRNSPEIRRRSVRVFPRNYLVLAMLISKDHFPVIQQYLRGKKTLQYLWCKFRNKADTCVGNNCVADYLELKSLPFFPFCTEYSSQS